MKAETPPLGQDFSLDFLAARLAGLDVPQGPFDPTASWRQSYGVYTFAALRPGPIGHRAGTLSIHRRVDRAGGSLLKIDYEKLLAGGCRSRVTGTVECAGDALATPRQWSYRSEVARPGGKVFDHSRIARSAAAGDGGVEFSDAAGRRRVAIDGPYTINWALFEAVQRLPRQPFPLLRFTLLDHFDQVKPEQTLAFRGPAKVSLGDRTARLYGFDLLGRGNVPWVDWVDEHGRLLFVMAGLEVYLLESSRQQPAG